MPIHSLIVQLWEATLCHAPSMVPQLLAFFPCLVDIIERSFDHLQVGAVHVGLMIIWTAIGIAFSLF